MRIFSGIYAVMPILVQGKASWQSMRIFNATTWKPTAFAEPSDLVKSSQYCLELERIGSQNTDHSSAILVKKTPQPVLSTDGAMSFSTKITIGQEDFQVAIDTASSATWVVEEDFRCFSPRTGQQKDESYCRFGKAYTRNPSFMPIDNEIFKIKLG